VEGNITLSFKSPCLRTKQPSDFNWPPDKRMLFLNLFDDHFLTICFVASIVDDNLKGCARKRSDK
jgi:hypothetical protein